MAHYFIAIHLPESLRSLYSAWQQELKVELPYKKWTHPDDLHITLKFLGETDDKQLYLLKESLAELPRQNDFILTLKSIGIFGKANRPRVLWVDVSPSDQLTKLQKEIERICIEVGFATENRAYRPHMTLAKKWSNDSNINEDVITEMQKDFSERNQFNVTGYTLFRIHPRQIPSYEAVKFYSF